MRVDPLASMRCWELEIEIGERTYTIPALPAASWWPVLAEIDPDRVLDLIDGGSPLDPANLDDLLLAGRISGDDLATAVKDAIEEITGRSLHAAMVLAVAAGEHWAVIGGEMLRRGFRWDEAPIGAALDLIYSIIMAGLPEKTEDGKRRPREEFERLLDEESVTGGKRSDQKMIADFEALAGPRPTATPARSSAAPSEGERPRSQRSQRRPRLAGP